MFSLSHTHTHNTPVPSWSSVLAHITRVGGERRFLAPLPFLQSQKAQGAQAHPYFYFFSSLFRHPDLPMGRLVVPETGRFKQTVIGKVVRREKARFGWNLVFGISMRAGDVSCCSLAAIRLSPSLQAKSSQVALTGRTRD